MYRPLADVIRPVDFSDVVGQDHILGKNTVLRRSLEGGNLSNMIFYGPSGVGKTTVAGIIASKTNRALHRLNATTASISDIKAICAEIGGLTAHNGILLYLDEIQSAVQRFSNSNRSHQKLSSQSFCVLSAPLPAKSVSR